ncbi:hypothetical protein [Enterovibrio baiacu]|uniref:hypothetical protein n=1 Tax=Enterovibrio baiacu TaxID=2491023 RepID=UPI003D0A27CD
MTIKLMHQAGHNSNWNRDSFEKDKVGVGIIYSPVHDDCEKIKKYNEKLKYTSLFDPQFYLPSSGKPKFKTYDFFPNTILGKQGFSTIDYNYLSLESAKRCVEFQLEQGFAGIVIPTRFFEQLTPDYTDKQSESFVSPFLSAIKDRGIVDSSDIYLTVPITSHMINSREYKENILNWITGYPEIDGVYIICQHDRKTKQVVDSQFLYEYMSVVKATIDADLDVIVGYTNTEALLFSLCGNLTLTIGAFENTRIFSLDKFVVSDETKRGPKPRIYIPKLLNWVNFEQAKMIKNNNPEIWKSLCGDSKYSDEAFSATKELNFQSPLLYKHYFLKFNEQVNELSSLDVANRYATVRSWILEAQELYEEISEIPLEFDKHGSGEHLSAWLDAINLYYSQYIK